MSERHDESRKNEAEVPSSDDDPEVVETDDADEDDTQGGDKMPDGISPLLDVGSEE